MPFSDFHGNAATVRRLREMLARNRFPHAVILSGPEGAGKYTLAQMTAKAMNCLEAPIETESGLPDFCGHCSNCTRISEADDLETRIAEAIEARESLKETDKKETRILIQTHPEVMVVPPDPPQLLIKIGQVRRVIESIYYKPVEARRRVYIFTASAFMKEAANSLLKVLEEPPESASLFLLTQNPGELLPTIRSRCIHFVLSPLTTEEIAADLSRAHKEWPPKQRELVARLSNGALGKARNFRLAEYHVARKDALTLLKTALDTRDHSELFRTTDTYRGGAEGKDKTEDLIRCLYGLLEDMMLLQNGAAGLVRNTDLTQELTQMSKLVSLDWIEQAAYRLKQVESGMRRNLLRSLSLDAMVGYMEEADAAAGR
ncbi:MAG: DNA polymerase III subunit delta' [Acidobacteriales bacterium]|nr:DNA polymerase III subunit delta' [Terriglobales bacterium]